MEGEIKITCPCCGNLMTVDPETGEILAEERPAHKPKSFDEAADEVRGGAKRREEAFTKAADKTRRLQDTLDKKFEEARKKAADDKTRPRTPFDFD